jgi:hypothetical protein
MAGDGRGRRVTAHCELGLMRVLTEHGFSDVGAGQQ